MESTPFQTMLGGLGIGFAIAAFGFGNAWWFYTVHEHAKTTVEWPSTQGVVTASVFYPRTTEKGGNYGEFDYEYTVGGQRYESDLVSWADTQSAGYHLYEVGDAVEVFYNPKDPQEAVLITGTDSWTPVQIVLSMLLGLAGLGAIGVTVWVLPQASRNSSLPEGAKRSNPKA